MCNDKKIDECEELYHKAICHVQEKVYVCSIQCTTKNDTGYFTK